ncbi:hypothetical protein IJH02_01570 [Candidatus Saccharibacteria bacterium]|nr:hypothetical protein [Candidatus Saccharibacteria bacterium]
MKVTFLGAGAFGSVLGNITKENGNEVKFYDPIKFPKNKLEDAIKDAEVIVYVAPSAAAKRLLPKLPKDVPLICASKGFVSMKPFEEFEDFSALGGASFSEDLEKGYSPYDNEIVLTASSELSEQLFTTDYLQIEYFDDTYSILLCGALKNVYAIGAGMHTENRPAGVNPRMMTADDAVFMRAVAFEMPEVLEANGADPEAMMLSCGLRDFTLTATEGSRNYRFGKTLKENPGVSGLEIGSTVEGVAVIESLKDYPEFEIPESAEILKDIIEKVENAIK